MIDEARAYLDAKRAVESIEAALKAAKEVLENRERAMLALFEEGAQNIKIDGVTVYLHRQLWARPVATSKEQLAEELKASDLAGFVHENINTQQLSAWVRELEATGQEVPARIQPLLEVTEQFSVRSRKG